MFLKDVLKKFLIHIQNAYIFKVYKRLMRKTFTVKISEEETVFDHTEN